MVFQYELVNVLLQGMHITSFFTHCALLTISFTNAILKNNNSLSKEKCYQKSQPLILVAMWCLLLLASCKKSEGTVAPRLPPAVVLGEPDVPPASVPGILNTAHLEKLIVPVLFPNGAKALGVYIYSNAPNYIPASNG